MGRPEKYGRFFGKLGPQTKKAIDWISENGVSKMTRENARAIMYPLTREAKKRVRQLEAADLTDTPAYRYYKEKELAFEYNKNLSLNQLKGRAKDLYDFLSAKTSSFQGAQDYVNSTINAWIGKNTTKEQREKLWDLYHRLEKDHPQILISPIYGSDELAQDLYEIQGYLNRTDFDVDAAYEMITDMTEQGYITPSGSGLFGNWFQTDDDLPDAF